ncbi:MAG: 6-pyruvoyltetrahydropterin/6-carboxytetrahydropterin synthase [Verrucomicrobiota bacterium]|jgi:6-pyruvoyltetrahydropterin/6-carboxytetrahydropterin synthase
MLLTVSKRLEFSASRRLFVKGWSDAENLAAFGPETSARYGTGRNYVAYFIFSGVVDPTTGMLMNISEIKERVGRVLRDGFDHKFLNEDNNAFADVPPTTENIARQLFLDAAPLFTTVSAKLVACHLSESEERSATYFGAGALESNYWFEFSAARQTTSPRLTPEENQKLFGVAASPFGHGHNYRARLTFRGESNGSPPLVRFSDIQSCLESLRSELDHKNLNREVVALIDQPITTENLARHIHERVGEKLRIHRVRLHERDDFFAEHWDGGKYFLGLQIPFSAAHRLHAVQLAAEDNLALYGKCNNPLGHGHRYLTEATIGGLLDERSGALMDFEAFRTACAEALQPWQDKHLDVEMEEFRDKPSTGENIVQALWPRFDSRLDCRLVRLRLWETVNNRFTLRKIL